MEGVGPVDRRSEVTCSHGATGPMRTAYAERSAVEDENSMDVQFLLDYHKNCSSVCVLKERGHVSKQTHDWMCRISLVNLPFLFASLCRISVNA